MTSLTYSREAASLRRTRTARNRRHFEIDAILRDGRIFLAAVYVCSTVRVALQWCVWRGHVNNNVRGVAFAKYPTNIHEVYTSASM